MDIELELTEANERAHRLEQEATLMESQIRSLHHLVSSLEKQIEQLQGTQIESTCDQCGVIFTQANKGRRARFCSHSCRQRHYKSDKDFERAMSLIINERG
jgi:predicted nuclease with TOPRIM domain